MESARTYNEKRTDAYSESSWTVSGKKCSMAFSEMALSLGEYENEAGKRDITERKTEDSSDDPASEIKKRYEELKSRLHSRLDDEQTLYIEMQAACIDYLLMIFLGIDTTKWQHVTDGSGRSPMSMLTGLRTMMSTSITGGTYGEYHYHEESEETSFSTEGTALTADGRELSGFGRELADVSVIDTRGLDKRINECSITVMCDVRNPLCGKTGAAYTFAGQKGASPETTEILEKGMCSFRDVIRSQFGTDCDMIEGAGAAGGLGAALEVFLGGRMQSGIETVLQLIGFDEKLKGTDLVITGEGCTDSQSIYGKVMMGVGLHAEKMGVPCIGLSGSLGEGAESIFDYGILSLQCIADRPMTLEYAMENAGKLYYAAAVRMFRMVKAGISINKQVVSKSSCRFTGL